MNESSGIASAEIEGNDLILGFVGEGDGVIKVTAEDGHGGSVTADFPVHGVLKVVVFRDDFDELSGHWKPDEDTDVEIQDGHLMIKVNKQVPYVGYMPRSARVKKFEVSMRLRNLTEDMWGGVILIMDSSDSFSEMWVVFGPDGRRGFLNPHR